MEYLPDGSVHDRMESRFISCHEAVMHGVHILRGLSHAHSKNVIHGDIKPANIMCQGNISKLSDFGLAIDSTSAIAAARADYAYMTHMAPELFHPQGNNTVLTDVFAVGSTIFRISNNIFGWSEYIAETTFI